MASKPVGIIMASVAALLDSPRAVRSPILHDKAVKLLLAMLGPQLDVGIRTPKICTVLVVRYGIVLFTQASAMPANAATGLLTQPALCKGVLCFSLLVADVHKSRQV